VFHTPLSLFRVLAFAEVVSWTLLIAGLILRATLDLSIAVTIGGGIHGFVFLSYGATAVLVAMNQRWRTGPTVVAIVSAVIPYATIPTEIWLHRTGRLDGRWRTEPGVGADRWYDPLMRWFLRRPWVLAVLLIGAIVAAYVILLILGPPGGK
tara:strand:+ start:267 stop:722 length:456 start_codon:yes stop_codon:yes gene_type:complete